MREFMAAAKALADENRVRVLLALRGRELCVCQIVEFLRLAPSTVSRHMAVLHRARLVESRKEGRWVYYRLSGAKGAVVQGAIRWVRESVAKSGQIRADAETIKAVTQLDKEEICARYHRS